MHTVLTYRGRSVTTIDVAFIDKLMADDPHLSRRALSRQLCEVWDWKQANGELKDALCRGLLLALHRAGYIELPPPRWLSSRGAVRRRSRATLEVDTTPIACRLHDLGKLHFRQVRRSDDEALLDALIECYHYLGYTRPVGEHLKYLVTAKARPVACFVWSSAPRHLAARDHYLGWSAEARRSNLPGVVYNSRFLIMPWVEVPHLASHLLSRMTRMLSEEWQRVYAHPLFFAETFVDPTRFKGTCYRAANWVYLGRTTGRGKDDQTHRQNRTLKDIFGLPLDRHFRQRLSMP